MTFRIDERQNEGVITWVGEWPFAARAHFIRSNEYDTFIRELRRYVRGEVPGRSFLISGHRGTGKTSLVRQAVEDLTRTIIDTSFQAARHVRNRDADRMLDEQRPLLVKLYGPGVLDPAKSAPPTNGAAPTAFDPTTAALEQITIALYRALAAEFGRSFANHARDTIYQAGEAALGRAQVADNLELAGQFTLELDNIPQPATLRDFYRRLDRIEAGVLWPYKIGQELRDAGLNDRGIREIVALATAAQAFEVCSGDVEAKRKSTETNARENSVETKGEATLKDVVNKVLGLAVGVGVGVLSDASVGTTAAAGLGLATAVLSTLTLSWSSKRSAKSERTLDYTFIRRRDKQSLERDLPLVIQRVREAGLAPVFVLDELDKVDDPSTAIANLIKRLKHLTTDFGCFCFLTDRDYYEHVLRKVQKEAFPVEHTFFSHMLFILPHPDKFLDYIRDITRADSVGTGTGIGTPIDETARSIFGLFVLHRSKLNMAEVLREIAEQCHADGILRPSEGDLRSPEYMLVASIQLAIGYLLKRDAMRRRVEAEPRFMQWAIDALYMLSRAWERQDERVELDRHGIVKCLLERSGKLGPHDDPDAAEQMLLEAGMGLIDLNIIERNVVLLADLLSNSAQLKSELSNAGHGELAELIPPYNLIKPFGEDGREYEFLYDIYGENVEVREQLKGAPGGLLKELVDRILARLESLQAFETVLAGENLSLADLIALQVLPSTINPTELLQARDRLTDATKRDVPYEQLSKDLSLVESIVIFLGQCGSRLATLFRLSLQVAADARHTTADDLVLRPAMEAVARFVDLRDFFQ